MAADTLISAFRAFLDPLRDGDVEAQGFTKHAPGIIIEYLSPEQFWNIPEALEE